jgi:hypothetical protein
MDESNHIVESHLTADDGIGSHDYQMGFPFLDTSSILTQDLCLEFSGLAHDDSCLDQRFAHPACFSGGMKNHHLVFPGLTAHGVHRLSNPTTMTAGPFPARGRHSVSIPANSSQQYFNAGMSFDSYMPTPDLDLSSLIGPRYNGRVARCNAAIDEDCTSMACSSQCDACCQSQCGQSAAGDVCRDSACVRAASPCTDIDCITKDLTDGDKAAAETLASFGENPPQVIPKPSYRSRARNQRVRASSNLFLQNQTPQHSLSGMQSAVQHSNLPKPSTSPLEHEFQHSDIFTNDLMDWDVFYNHILSAHPSEEQSHCIRPCIIDNLTVNQKCHFPRYSQLQSQNDEDMGTPTAPDFHELECGATVTNPAAFIEHFNQEHRNTFMGEPYTDGSDRFAQSSGFGSPIVMETPDYLQINTKISPSSGHRLALSQELIEEVSSIASTVTTASESPEIESPNTPTSEISHQTLHPEDKYMCKWTVGGAKVCGVNFENDKELQDHCKDVHLQCLNKSESGFQCHWDGCSRSGCFTQKSKLERHLQTHTGCK